MQNPLSRTNYLVRYVPIPRKVVDYSEMRRAFEECVTATGKLSNALIMRTYVVIFANQGGFPEFARNMLADMPRTNEVTSATDLHSLVRRIRFIKFFSKMLRIDVSVAGEEVVKNLVETAMTLGNPEVLTTLLSMVQPCGVRLFCHKATV